jgi:hypothetical protein
MTQLPKGAAERAGLIHEQKPADKERPPEAEQRETQNEADIALRDAREKAEIERVPGGKNASAVAGSTPDVESADADEAEEAGEEQTGILDDDPLYDSEVIGEDEEVGVVEKD